LSVGAVSSRQQGRKLPRTPESRQALPPSARRRGWRSDALPAFARKSALVNATGFGIARITDASRTKTGMVLGTPSFMSPEQLAGQHIDGRSDRYSLGVMLFQMLTGTLPSRGDSMAALMYRIANQSPPRCARPATRIARRDRRHAHPESGQAARSTLPERRRPGGRTEAAASGD
jgi:serine/threonine-protein kinase